MSALAFTPDLLQVRAAIANRWVEAAGPILKAVLDLNEIGFDLCQVDDLQNRRMARADVGKAAKELRDLLDGIRDSHIADQRFGWHRGMSDDEAEAADGFNDDLDGAVVSVEAAERAMLAGLNAAYLGRAA